MFLQRVVGMKYGILALAMLALTPMAAKAAMMDVWIDGTLGPFDYSLYGSVADMNDLVWGGAAVRGAAFSAHLTYDTGVGLLSTGSGNTPGSTSQSLTGGGRFRLSHPRFCGRNHRGHHASY